MKKFLNKEVVNKSTVGMELITTIALAIIFSIIIYICFTSLNSYILNILTSINDGKITALKATLIIFPIILIILLTGKLAMILAKENK